MQKTGSGQAIDLPACLLKAVLTSHWVILTCSKPNFALYFYSMKQ